MNIFSYVYHYVGYFIVTHMFHEHGPPTSFNYPESFPELQNYQDAWAFLNNTVRMALLYRTFKADEKYPTTCVWMKRLQVNESEKTFLGEVSLCYNQTWRSMNLTLKAMTLEGYNVSTFFSVGLTARRGVGREYLPVVYQVPGKCIIVRQPSHDTEMEYACDLWVSLGTLKKNNNTAPKGCVIMYDYLCETTKHKMFGEDCIDKLKESGEITSSTKPTEAATAASC
ncbi:uncharacterized protein LOC135379054 [Ornithodoros turicata]|uniref:uncharacterized protein LOC135379054 n=1 Tax=Ornithodoros turicata TaxID=34597 RepID=UPI0031389A3D